MKRLAQMAILLLIIVMGTRQALEMRGSLEWQSTEVPDHLQQHQQAYV